MSNLSDDNGRVFDAPSDNFVYRLLPPGLWPYAQLARWDRPIGWQLLMWPCFWSAAMAAAVTAEANAFRPGQFIAHLFLFWIGAVAMRGAGCTYNDLVDHEIDSKVARTRSRPLPSGRVTRRQAKIFILLQALTGLVVLLCFNLFTIVLAIASLAIVALYPFAKRFTDWPQFVLGLAFSWGALVGWSAVFGSLSAPALLVYVAAVLWTIGYDTIYAHQDKEDDALIGVRSTARLFGDNTLPFLIFFYGAMLALMAVAFHLAGLGWPAFAGLVGGGGILAWQLVVLDINDGDQCKRLFLANHPVGMAIFAGLVVAIFLG
ncbi:4-hydroxybenzoate octaprenyltransferase [Martelella endophytica]|uniref:4-hydroxybenzoate octaprenyltransferase n=1 Tax=Martelella endophytica TaxID=1486262 RepID=A0A0D5LMU5_MAREN|nr:4-hydroxybenzoate octaprenyltransferase [Martelella endophytica]AJY45280.1 4-hydroxybenzoate polyprenyltransferase [Martelella endophytica]